MIQIISISEWIKTWNDKLNSFAAEYMDSPWVGMVLFLGLFAFGCWAISALTKR